MDIDTARLWIRIFLIGAAICVTSVPVIYAFYPWRTRRLGQLFMLQAFMFAVAIDTSLLFSFWRPDSILVRFVVNMILLVGLAVSTLGMAVHIWKLSHPRKGRHWKK